VSDPGNVQQYPRGWYPDPATPGRDRWWDGRAQTEYTAKTVNPSWAVFGVGYAHSMRMGANRVLLPARILATGALVLLLLLFVGAIVVASTGGSIVPLAAGALLGAAAFVAAIVLGILGLRRSSTLGGRGLAIWAIAVSAFWVLFLPLPVVVALAGAR
jgi:hypothetical protein